MGARSLLEAETRQLMDFLGRVDAHAVDAYDVIEARLDYFKTVTQIVDRDLAGNGPELRSLQQWFRETSNDVFLKSRLMNRARTWPEGYPGDYLTLEMLYANRPEDGGAGIGSLLERYFLTRTLAVAVRSRLRRLADLLDARAVSEDAPSAWLNIACGPCRELLSVRHVEERRVFCVDRDPNALRHAQTLLSRAGRNGNGCTFLAENAFRLGNPAANRRRLGGLTTIYSAGLFDYIPSSQLTKLLRGLYDSLVPGGVLIAPFKDGERYDTYDYHWIVQWDFFLQRSEDDIRALLLDAGIPARNLEMERDDSGVIMFFIARK